MPTWLISWKSTFLGFAAIIAVIAKWIQDGKIDLTDINSAIGILAGLGLIAAKDSNIGPQNKA